MIETSLLYGGGRRQPAFDFKRWQVRSLLIVVVVSVTTLVVAFKVLWTVTVGMQEERLRGMASNISGVIDAVSRENLRRADGVVSPASLASTVHKVANALNGYSGFGKTGEFVLGRREGDNIVFLLDQRRLGFTAPLPVPAASALAEPMRLAVQGKSGVMRGLDYRGRKVLAAFVPVPSLGAGFVAKIDWNSEIVAPFVEAGGIASIGLCLVLIVACVAFRRISGPLRHNDALLRELKKLSHALDQTPLAVSITDRAGTIEYVNPAFTETTGYSPAEAVGKTPRILDSGSTSGVTYSELWATISRGRTWSGDILERRKDGSEYWSSVYVAPVRDDDLNVTHIVFIDKDISERKLLETQMSAALHQTELANRAKSEFIANMSHELRTPLNAILGFSSIIAAEAFGPVGQPKYLEYSQDILKSAEHLMDLINDILDVSSIEAGKIENHEDMVSFNEVADACIRLVAPRAEAGGVRLSSETVGNVVLRADERRMKQVLLNLLSNAVKFTSAGGTVALRAEVAASGDFVVRVVDTGIGMDAAGVAKALEPFGQVDSSHSRRHVGTGLGLPLAIGLVESHGGRVRIESEPAKGTTVVVTLPAERIVCSCKPPDTSA